MNQIYRPNICLPCLSGSCTMVWTLKTVVFTLLQQLERNKLPLHHWYLVGRRLESTDLTKLPPTDVELHCASSD